ALTRMLSFRTLWDAFAMRSALARASASRFMFSIARRMYSALGNPIARAHRSPFRRTSSGIFSEIAFMDIHSEYPILISLQNANNRIRIETWSCLSRLLVELGQVRPSWRPCRRALHVHLHHRFED